MTTNEMDRAACSTAKTLARERGWDNVTMIKRRLIVMRGGELTDFVDVVLAPRGLVPFTHECWTWQEACRLLGMVPPARGGV